jgi:hypothetical protein
MAGQVVTHADVADTPEALKWLLKIRACPDFTGWTDEQLVQAFWWLNTFRHSALESMRVTCRALRRRGVHGAAEAVFARMSQLDEQAVPM